MTPHPEDVVLGLEQATARAVLDSAPDAVVIVDPGGEIRLVNEQTERLFRYPRGELIGRPVEDLLPERYRGVHVAHRQGYVEDPRRRPMGLGLDLSGRRKDGTTFPVDISLGHLTTDVGILTMAFIRDMAERRAAEESQARLAAIVQASHDAMLATTDDGIVMDWNPGAEHLLGFTAEEMVGRSVDSLMLHDHRAEEKALVRRAAETLMPDEYETTLLRKDGTTVAVSVTLSPIHGASPSSGGIAWVCRDVTERKAAETALQERELLLARARDQALEASRLKSQFLANMSHEVRTPMNGVLGMAQLLLQTNLDMRQRRYVLALSNSGQHLLEILNDILDFSKIEAGKLETEERDFDLLGLLEGVISLLSSPAHDKGLRLDLEIEPDAASWVRGDPSRLRQMLINLLGNAVKFTDEGSVGLRVCRVGPDRLRFEVVDTGIGIDASDHSRVLDPFYQADASTTRRFGGTGLGLAICRQLAGLMGGVLDFSSELGRGSTFWFEVPMPTRSGTPAQ